MLIADEDVLLLGSFRAEAYKLCLSKNALAFAVILPRMAFSSAVNNVLILAENGQDTIAGVVPFTGSRRVIQSGSLREVIVEIDPAQVADARLWLRFELYLASLAAPENDSTIGLPDHHRDRPEVSDNHTADTEQQKYVFAPSELPA